MSSINMGHTDNQRKVKPAEYSAAADGSGYAIELDGPETDAGKVFGATPLMPAGVIPASAIDPVKSRLAKLRNIGSEYHYPYQSRAEIFYRQALFMADFEDNKPFSGNLKLYYPTYQLLTTTQLRGYFTWRTVYRAGDTQRCPLSFAYLYLYETINGIGSDTAEEILDKLEEFEQRFLLAGFGDGVMKRNLHKWMLEVCIVHNVSPDRARRYLGSEEQIRDKALGVLKDPDAYTDSEVAEAILVFAPKRMSKSPVLTAAGDRGLRLFAAAWRYGVKNYRDASGRDLFDAVFGHMSKLFYYPFSNAVYHMRENISSGYIYRLDSHHEYRVIGSNWYAFSYDRYYFQLHIFGQYIGAADRLLRCYLRTGRLLKNNADQRWAEPYIQQAIAAEEEREREERLQSIKIDMSKLADIRTAAASTRESLLTDEERAAEQEAIPAPPPTRETAADNTPASAASADAEHRIVAALLDGSDPAPILKEMNLMPSIAADNINARFFDDIGDNIVETDEASHLHIVEDYIDDVRDLLNY